MTKHTIHNQADGTPKLGTFRAVLADPPWSLQQHGALGGDCCRLS